MRPVAGFTLFFFERFVGTGLRFMTGMNAVGELVAGGRLGSFDRVN